jgi:hypothetical protein
MAEIRAVHLPHTRHKTLQFEPSCSVLQLQNTNCIFFILSNMKGRHFEITDDADKLFNLSQFNSSHWGQYLIFTKLIVVWYLMVTSKNITISPSRVGLQESYAGLGLPIVEASRSQTLHSAGLLWTSDRIVAETSTWQHTTLTRDKRQCPMRDSNPQSQQASSRGPTP